MKGTFATLECALENAIDIFDISNKGEIVGAYAFFGGVHGFILEANSTCFDVIDPNPNGGSLTEAWGVNDGGAVVLLLGLRREVSRISLLGKGHLHDNFVFRRYLDQDVRNKQQQRHCRKLCQLHSRAL